MLGGKTEQLVVVSLEKITSERADNNLQICRECCKKKINYLFMVSGIIR